MRFLTVLTMAITSTLALAAPIALAGYNAARIVQGREPMAMERAVRAKGSFMLGPFWTTG